jgi:glycerol-3-phosphate acyltransferase PlsY
MVAALLFVGAYLSGSLPVGPWVARLTGTDVRARGSGNTGATNVARTAGIIPGVITLLGDVAKGFLPVVVAQRVGSGPWAAAAIGLAALFGHVCSVFLRFSGGKGVATACGVFLALAPAPALVSLTTFVVVALATRYASVASMIAAVALPVACAVRRSPAATVVAACITAAVVILRHRENLARLRRGVEPPFRARRG